MTVLVGEPASSAGSSASEGVAELLARRSTAVVEGDRRAFMSTVLPTASPAFKRRQERMFAGFDSLDLVSYELEADWERLGDLVRPRANEAYPDADLVALPMTVERYRLEGLDPEPALEELFWTYVRIEDEWFVASDSDLEDVGLYSARHLWDSGPMESHETEHFSFYSHPCASDCVAIEAIGAQSERSLGRVEPFWSDIPDRTAVLVPRDSAELERMIQSTFDLDDFVAFAYSSEDPERGFTGNRVMLNPDAFRGIDAGSAFVILAHEMLHIATREAAGPFVPFFIEEGFAEYVATDASQAALGFFRSDVAAGRFGERTPLDFEFSTGSSTDIYRSYQESLAAVHFFIDRWGMGRFERFYRRLGRVLVEPGTTRYWVDRTLSETIGVDLPRFERLWADSIVSS